MSRSLDQIKILQIYLLSSNVVKKSLVMNLNQKCPKVCCISCCTHHSQVVENISLRENLRKHQLRNVI